MSPQTNQQQIPLTLQRDNQKLLFNNVFNKVNLANKHNQIRNS